MNINVKLLLGLVVIDMLWLNIVFKNTFANMIHNVQGFPMEFNLQYAFIAYLFIYIMASTFLPKLSVTEAGLLGFLTYGIYDFTNLATIKKWNLNVAIVDTIWGGVLFALLRKYFV